MPAVAELPPVLVVDASVGLKWVVGEAGSEIAVALISDRRLLVPDLFWIETANGLAAKVRRAELTRAEARDAWHDLCQAPVLARAATPETLSPALTLAQDFSHPIYDCIYLALAIAEGCPVVTADRKFAEIVRVFPSFAGKLLLLDEIAKS